MWMCHSSISTDTFLSATITAVKVHLAISFLNDRSDHVPLMNKGWLLFFYIHYYPTQ